MFGALMDLTGIRSSAFMLMYGVVWVSLIWMYFTEVRRAPCHGCARCRASRQPLIFRRKPHHVCHHHQRAPGASAHHLGTGGQVLLGARRRSHRQLNLWISVPALFLAFAIWQVWSVVAVTCRASASSTRPTSSSGWPQRLLCPGATLRIFYSFMVPLVGGRRWTAISTASLLIPAIGIGFAVQDNTTAYPTMLILAAVRPGWRQLQLQHGQHQLLLPQRSARVGTGCECRPG